MMQFLMMITMLFLTSQVAAERLDDSLSPRQQFDMELDWKYRNLDKEQDTGSFNALTARASRVEIRLNTARFVGKRARIFMGLPLNISGTGDSTALRMSWRSNGVFTDGSVTSGNRNKLFEGTVPGPVMSDVLDIEFEIDARQLYGALRFEPIYEIEVINP